MCQRCGKNHVCVRLGCGHSRYENHQKSSCTWRQHGAVPGCRCIDYLESEGEVKCNKELEADCNWPEEVLKLLKTISTKQNNRDNQKLIDLVQRGERLPRPLRFFYPNVVGYRESVEKTQT